MKSSGHSNYKNVVYQELTIIFSKNKLCHPFMPATFPCLKHIFFLQFLRFLTKSFAHQVAEYLASTKRISNIKNTDRKFEVKALKASVKN